MQMYAYISIHMREYMHAYALIVKYPPQSSFFDQILIYAYISIHMRTRAHICIDMQTYAYISIHMREYVHAYALIVKYPPQSVS